MKVLIISLEYMIDVTTVLMPIPLKEWQSTSLNKGLEDAGMSFRIQVLVDEGMSFITVSH